MSTRGLPTRPLRALAEVALGRMRSPDRAEGQNMVPYLRAANVKDGTLDLSDVKSMDFSPSEQSTYALRSGDVLVTEGAGSLAAVGASAVWSGEIDGVVCFQNTLLRLRPRGDTNIRYLMWWARHAYGSGLLASVAEGANIYHLGAANVRLLPASIPNPSVQRAIADYLDVETARIDGLVENLRKSVGLLRERSTTLITQAVTSGLSAGDPGVTSRGYGLAGAWPLLGVVAPATGWETRRIGDLVEVTNGYPFDSDLFGPDGTLPLVRIRDLFLDEFATYVRGPIPDQVVLHDGDIVIGMDGDFELTVWRRGPAALNQRMCLLRPRPGVDARFVAYSLRRHLRVLNDLTYATTVKHLSSFEIMSERILCPPGDQQRVIADLLDAVTARIDRLALSRERQIDLLRERRRALISSAVTGQLQISGVAA